MSQAYLVSGGRIESREVKLGEIYQKAKPGKKIETDPDVHLLESETSIKIEDVRELERILSLKPYDLPPKIALIKEAEKLTLEAQGALLKILEEPPGETIFILTTRGEANLLPTIISRCRQIYLPSEAELSLDKEETDKIKKLVEKILRSGAGERLKIAEDYTTREEATLFCQKQLVYWHEQLTTKPNAQTTRILREIQKSLKYLSANVNPRLVLENLLLSYP